MLRRSAAAVFSVVLVSCALASPSEAAQPNRVVPSNGKWAGLSEVTSCDTITSSEITDTSGPDDLACALPVSGTTEAVDFRIASRHIPSLAFDVIIQCHASDADHWTAIPASGLLRMQFPVEETFGYPAGTVRATFDFRGQAAKVALFYEGTYSERGFSNRCVSQSNTPSVMPVRKRI